MIEWLGRHAWLIFWIAAGLAVSMLASGKHSLRLAIARIACGSFCAVLFPGPILDFLGRDPAVYGNFLAGLLAMTGYALVRLIANLDAKQMLELVRAIRGGKP